MHEVPYFYDSQFHGCLPGNIFHACFSLSPEKSLTACMHAYTHTHTRPKPMLGAQCGSLGDPLVYSSILGYSFLSGSCQRMGFQGQKFIYEFLESHTAHIQYQINTYWTNEWMTRLRSSLNEGLKRSWKKINPGKCSLRMAQPVFQRTQVLAEYSG